jgi:hypothetical protein
LRDGLGRAPDGSFERVRPSCHLLVVRYFRAGFSRRSSRCSEKPPATEHSRPQKRIQGAAHPTESFIRRKRSAVQAHSANRWAARTQRGRPLEVWQPRGNTPRFALTGGASLHEWSPAQRWDTGGTSSRNMPGTLTAPLDFDATSSDMIISSN